MILEKNEKLISSQTHKVTVQDKYIKVDKIVPQITIKYVDIATFVVRESSEVKTKLMEEERA